MNEPDDEDGLMIQAGKCPLIRAAYATSDTAVITRAENYHPPKRCIHVKKEKAK